MPRAADLPKELAGTRSFALLKASEAEAVPREEIRVLCESLRAAFGT